MKYVFLRKVILLTEQKNMVVRVSLAHVVMILIGEEWLLSVHCYHIVAENLLYMDLPFYFE